MHETTPAIPGITFPLNSSKTPNISTKPSQDFFRADIPSPYDSTPPNTHIIISDSPLPTDYSEDPLRIVIDLEVLDNLVTSSQKKAIPKPTPKLSKSDVGKSQLVFETEIQE